eukprot:TRINITY_DN2018_c0_g2_i1.p1 TRINITY_DN2018_c0_g2~~TRINITY_DN2018_c0_g2_i1.p1  ORF type:complete len:411 (+),score=89.97 TRINITY_DN2018_c0_g2_i1:178-1410(+)
MLKLFQQQFSQFSLAQPSPRVSASVSSSASSSSLSGHNVGVDALRSSQSATSASGSYPNSSYENTPQIALVGEECERAKAHVVAYLQSLKQSGAIENTPRAMSQDDEEVEEVFLFEADSDNDLKNASNSDAEQLKISGDVVDCWGTFGVNDGQFFNPWGIAATEDGEVYVVNYGTHSVHVYSQSGSFLRKFGSYGKEMGCLRNPWCVAVDGDEVYVTEQSNNRVSVFDRLGNFRRCWGKPGQFANPWGICVHEKLVYICQSDLHKVQVFDRVGNFQFEFGSRGSAAGCLNYPAGITANGDELFVADYCNHRICVFDLRGKFLRAIGNGVGDAEGEMDYPTCVQVLNGEVYVGEFENHRVSVFAARDGSFLRTFGGHGTMPGQMDGTYGLSIQAGKMYLCDYSSHRINVYQ